MKTYYTANYVNADSNFVISNLNSDVNEDGIYHQIICVLFNLLQRGCPTNPSIYLRKYIRNCSDKKIHFLNNAIADWEGLIKGYDANNDNPAKLFYEEILNSEFCNIPYLRQLIIPEVLLSDIIPDNDNTFYKQRVDFYVPIAKLVIEIDGEQHKQENQAILDKKRDTFLHDNGVKVIRIWAKDVKQKSSVLKEQLKVIKELIKETTDFSDYEYSYELGNLNHNIEDIYRSVAIIRLQITLLELCDRGILNLDDDKWNLRIINHEVSGYEEYAVNDLLDWLENLAMIAGMPFIRPDFVIGNEKVSEKGSISIEISVTKKLNQFDKRSEKIIYITNAWRQDIDYFYVHCADRINYRIDDLDEILGDIDIGSNGLNMRRRALRFLLKNLFGYDEFKPGQERVIINVLKGNDTIGLLPTSAGKSLCYQLASLLQPCISFCVCPIQSLMIDQKQNLEDKGITRVANISSLQKTQMRQQIIEEFAPKRYLWILVSPERFQDRKFRERLNVLFDAAKDIFGVATIDEVHCLSEWGHSFRTSYLNLVKTIKKYCGRITLLGLTATASERVLKNIRIELGNIDQKNVISLSSMERDELTFKVVKCDNKKIETVRVLEDFCRGNKNLFVPSGENTTCGIIFTPLINGNEYGCKSLAEYLGKYFNADIRYYCGNKPKDFNGKDWDKYKESVQDDFKNNRFSTLCATNAFGMGVDKPNVRYTIHYGLPSSIEALYQEGGRAGRDGNSAECVVLYTPETNFKGLEERCFDRASNKEIKDRVGRLLSYANSDCAIQLYLLASELMDINHELDIARNILDSCTGMRSKIISAKDEGELKDFQKVLYHLGIVGVVEDWTVDWNAKSLDVQLKHESTDVYYENIKTYVSAYDKSFYLRKTNDYSSADENTAILLMMEQLLEWYQDNIVYSRRESLKNVKELCENFNSKQAFKSNLEAFFKSDDVADLFGSIADDPFSYKLWFKIIDVNKIKAMEHGPRKTIMVLKRFLESYQNNVGLNYISGFLNLLVDDFKKKDGWMRFSAAAEAIATFDDSAKEYILSQTIHVAKVVFNAEQKNELSRFLIQNYRWKGTLRMLCKNFRDQYSLNYVIDYYESHYID